MPMRPIALTCGDPSGVGPELAVAARNALGSEVPFFWIGDPSHLPQGAVIGLIDQPAQAFDMAAEVMPVLALTFLFGPAGLLAFMALRLLREPLSSMKLPGAL